MNDAKWRWHNGKMCEFNDKYFTGHAIIWALNSREMIVFFLLSDLIWKKKKMIPQKPLNKIAHKKKSDCKLIDSLSFIISFHSEIQCARDSFIGTHPHRPNQMRKKLKPFRSPSQYGLPHYYRSFCHQIIKLFHQK